MQVRSLLQKKVFYFIFLMIVVFFMLLINIPLSNPQSETILPEKPTSTTRRNSLPSPLEKKPQIPSTNPTYAAKIQKERFWTRLPYWTERYKIEYRDSADVILIHLFLPSDISNLQKNALQIQYRDEALQWLRDNGAMADNLTIQYRIYE